MDFVGIRLVNFYLVIFGVMVYGYYGEIFFEGDILVIFIYEKLRLGDII